jgi:hypothetical protein
VSKSLQPRALFNVNEQCDDLDDVPDILPVSTKPVYKSPLQLLIDEMEDDIRVKAVELESARDHLSMMEKKFANPNLKLDKTKVQCGKCHLRIGHTKRNCSLGNCEGPQHCGDIDKHDTEKKQILDAQSAVKVLTRDLDKLKQGLALKKNTYEETCDTFFKKVLPYLVNTDVDKYYPVGSFGLRALAMGAVHPDMAIIEKYFRGVVPRNRNLDAASKTFQHIIKSQSGSLLNPKKERGNPVKHILEEHGVQFPNFQEPTATGVCVPIPYPYLPSYPPYVPPVQFSRTFPCHTGDFETMQKCESYSTMLPPKKRKF